MAKVTWLGDVDNPSDGYTDDAHCSWGGYIFPLGVAVEVTDPHIIAKAKTNRFFRYDYDTEPAPEPIDGSWPDEHPPIGDPFETLATPAEVAPPKRSHKKKV